MNHVKELLKMPSDELKANVQVCLEHSCAIFLGNCSLGYREEAYFKDRLSLEKGEPTESDLEFQDVLEVFRAKMKSLESIWQSVGPVKMGSSDKSLSALLLGIIQVFEMSTVPLNIHHILEPLVTGQWRIFVLNAVGLMSPSGMKIEVIREIVNYLLKEDFWEWCKRHVCVANECPSFNLYVNQRVKPLEKLLGEAPET